MNPAMKRILLNSIPYAIVITSLLALQVIKAHGKPYEVGRSFRSTTYTQRTGIEIIDRNIFCNEVSSGIINFRSVGEIILSNGETQYYQLYFTTPSGSKDINLNRACLIISDRPGKTGLFISKGYDVFVRPGNILYKVKEGYPYTIPPPKEDKNNFVYANWLGIRNEYLVETSKKESDAYKPLFLNSANRIIAWSRRFDVIRWIQNGLWIGLASMFGFHLIQILRKKLKQRRFSLVL